MNGGASHHHFLAPTTVAARKESHHPLTDNSTLKHDHQALMPSSMLLIPSFDCMVPHPLARLLVSRACCTMRSVVNSTVSLTAGSTVSSTVIYSVT